MIFGSVEARRVHPVAKRELARIAYPEPTLFRRVDEEETAERPEGLSADVLLALLIEQQHGAAGVGGLRGGYEAGEPGTNDDEVWLFPRASQRPVSYAPFY